MTATAAVNQLPLIEALLSSICFDMHVNLEPAQVVPTPTGLRMVFITAGGVIEGPKLSGEVLPGGGDWLLVGSDGTGRVDVRPTICTDRGSLIHYEARGIIKIPADGLDLLATGEVLEFTETYIRTTPRFETSDERCAWLNETVALSYNILSPNHIDYRIYGVLWTVFALPGNRTGWSGRPRAGAAP
jgi:uncharacterized protein DUF3237